ncbi:MAG: hypothetical protein IPK26_18610 [Planctomycetes bacterium]|nr:hypothetical protein [Planctomycetota bacterium]
MRLCPTVDGTASPLITHKIVVDVCMARQRTFYHKCHRCQYRGKAATWEPEPQTAMLNVHAAEEAHHVKVTPAPLPALQTTAASKPRSDKAPRAKKPRKGSATSTN